MAKQTTQAPGISYDEYRKHQEQLAYKKDQLLRVIAKKKETHAAYLKLYREYRDLDAKQETMTKELIELIPSRV